MSFWKKKEEPTEQTTFEAKSEKVAEKVVVKTNDSINDAIEQRFGKVQSALGAGTVITGKLSFDTTVRIDGKLNGEVYSADTLIVGSQAELKASINVLNLILLGSFEGEAIVRGNAELLKNSKFTGNLTTSAIRMDDGASCNADVKMSSKVQPIKAKIN